MNNVFRRNGIRPAPMRSKTLKRPGLALSVMLLGSLLAGCQHTKTHMTVTDAEAQCAAWRAITYSSKRDTAPTVKQVREHNATGKRLGCWR